MHTVHLCRGRLLPELQQILGVFVSNRGTDRSGHALEVDASLSQTDGGGALRHSPAAIP